MLYGYITPIELGFWEKIVFFYLNIYTGRQKKKKNLTQDFFSVGAF